MPCYWGYPLLCFPGTGRNEDFVAGHPHRQAILEMFSIVLISVFGSENPRLVNSICLD